MSQSKSPAPVFVREYPPFAMALGTSFLSWLMGSLTYDCIFGKVPDILLAILFGLIFLPSLWFCLEGWVTVITIRKVGLHMDKSGVRYVTAGPLGTRTHTLSWGEISNIKTNEKGSLVFETKEEPLKIFTAQLLENPEWMLERAKTWYETVKNKHGEDKTYGKVADLQTELEGVLCQSCGGSVDIQLGTSEEIACRYCGEKQSVSDKVKDALKRVSDIIRGLPAAHRQFQEKTLRRFVSDGGRNRRTLLGVGWGTAGVWLLFVMVELISTIARKESTGLNIPFIVGITGLAILSIVSGYVLVQFIERVAGTFSLPMQALAPVVSGGSARCRLCGANLPEKGTIRRCQYCQTDSVVVGKQLAAAERMAKEALQQAQDSVRQSTETAARLLDGTTGKMQVFSYTQFFWLHIPIVVALDGSTGMLIKVTGICLTMLFGNLISTILGLRWLKKHHFRKMIF